jgi:hypothetical protein
VDDFEKESRANRRQKRVSGGNPNFAEYKCRGIQFQEQIYPRANLWDLSWERMWMGGAEFVYRGTQVQTRGVVYSIAGSWRRPEVDRILFEIWTFEGGLDEGLSEEMSDE